MPAGFKYNITPDPIAKEAARFDTAYRLSGGFNLDINNLVRGSVLPSLAPIFVDISTRMAYAVKNIRVVEQAASGQKKVKIAKNSIIQKGDKYLHGAELLTVASIDNSNGSYDEITMSANLSAVIARGTVLTEGMVSGGNNVAVRTANYLNYAATKVEDGATITALGQIYEIDREKLDCPISDADVLNLGARFLFLK